MACQVQSQPVRFGVTATIAIRVPTSQASYFSHRKDVQVSKPVSPKTRSPAEDGTAVTWGHPLWGFFAATELTVSAGAHTQPHIDYQHMFVACVALTRFWLVRA